MAFLRPRNKTDGYTNPKFGPFLCNFKNTAVALLRYFSPEVSFEGLLVLIAIYRIEFIFSL